MMDGNTGNGRIKAAVQETLLEQMDKKLDTLLEDHDLLVRLEIHVTNNRRDINQLAEKGRDRDKSRRRESLAEMFIAALIGGSAWLRP